MKLQQAFIRLPLLFDATQLAREVEALPPRAWRPHPSGLPGNLAVALISRRGGDNDDFGGRMATTSYLRDCPYHRQVMASFDEVLARSRLMKLEAGCEVSSHVDFNYHWYTRVRVHIPVVTHPGVAFSCGDQRVHMQAGECWLFDNWRRHNVVNQGAQARIHLVVDLAGSSRFWRMARAAMRADASPRLLPYQPEKEVNILTENYNMLPVMAPGELDALVADLLGEITSCPANDPQRVEQYQLLLLDFAQDWRETWHRYGLRAQGRPHYQRLLQRLQQGLHPDRRALLIASNGVGANPVIVQRILRAALADEVADDYRDLADDQRLG